MFQQSLENIELEKMRDTKTIEADKAPQSNSKYKCYTPNKKLISNMKNNTEMLFSSNKRVSSFETPKAFDKKHSGPSDAADTLQNKLKEKTVDKN